jgi:hypothetical protein
MFQAMRSVPVLVNDQPLHRFREREKLAETVGARASVVIDCQSEGI